NVGKAMRAKFLVTAAVDRSGRHDARIRRIAHLADVVVRIGRVAYQRQAQIRADPLEALAYQQRVVLGLHAADVEEVAPAPQAKTARLAAPLTGAYLGAVGDENALLAIALAIVGANRLGVRHYLGRTEGRQPLRKLIPSLRQAVPLLAISLQSIH